MARPYSLGIAGRWYDRGQVWYFTQEDLFTALANTRTEVRLLVMRIRLEGNREQHLYSNFASPYAFWAYAQETPWRERCFNEIALPTQLQKVRIDLDLPGAQPQVGELLLSATVHSIFEAFQQRGFVLDLQRNILVFTSHQQGFKLSYHVIVDGYVCFCGADFQVLFQRIRNLTLERLAGQIPAELLEQYFDKSIATDKHPLRMYGSVKAGSERMKIWAQDWQMYGQRTRTLLSGEEPTAGMAELKASLITWPERCQILPELPAAVLAEPSFQGRNAEPEEEVELDESIAEKAAEWLEELGQDEYFQVDKVVGSLIKLTRVKPGLCLLCRREHSKDNSFFAVSRGPPPRVTLKCHRDYSLSLQVCGDASEWVADENNPPVAPAVEIKRLPQLAIDEKIDRMCEGQGWYRGLN